MGDTVLDTNNQIILSIREKIENISPEQRHEMLNQLYDKWVGDTDIIKNKCGLLPDDPLSLFNYLSLAIGNFGLDIKGLQRGSFERATLITVHELIYLRIFFESDEENKDEKPELTIKYNKILKSVVDSENAIRSVLQLENSMIESDIGDSEHLDIIRFTPHDYSTNNPFQNLLLYLLENLMRKGYRKYDQDCYVQVYTEAGYNTHFWKKAMTLKQFIFSTVRKEVHYEMWQNLTAAKDNPSAAVKHLIDYQGGEFEEIKRDRHVFAFNNGIYITRKNYDENLNIGKDFETGGYTDEWIPYEGPKSKKIGASVVSCKYFNIDFDEDTLAKPDDPNHLFNDWWEIICEHCPTFKSIMDYQEWEPDVQRWLCILIGRNLYSLGEIEEWQVIGYLLGQAGSGKSTILTKIVKEFYEPIDVGILSNNIEKKFGLSALHEKLMYIAPEIKGDFTMEQAEFQSIISGEDVQIAKKHEQAQSVVWKVPGMMAGNEVPRFNDNAGSISRRLLVFMFNKKVNAKKTDTQMGKKLEKEIGYILHACNRAYLEAVNKYGSMGVWTIIPQYFKDSRDDMAETTNALTHFLKSEHVIMDPTKYVREKVFTDRFNLHCKDTNMEKPRWTTQYWMGPFETFGIKVKKDTKRRYPNIDGASKYRGTFIFGVDIIAEEEEQLSDPEN